jgi:hypothetical protein
VSSPIEKARKAARYDQVMALADRRLQPQVLAAFRLGVKSIKDALVISRLEQLLEQGQLAAAEQLVAWEGSLNGLRNTVQQSLLDAAQDELKGAGQVLRTNFALDIFNPRVVEFAQQYSYGLVRQITNQTRDMVREVVLDALKTGSPPRQQAQDIKRFLGLTTEQRAHIVNYRRKLEEGDLNALRNLLRDKRSDPKVMRLFQSGQPLAKDDIDRLVARYTDKWLAYRAETVARTESLRALNAGARLTWLQAVDTGQYREPDLYRRWFVAPSCCVCPNCKAVPGMNPKGVGLREDFDTPLGDFMDPPLHPNCRCYVFTRPR